VTWDELRALALALPGVEDGSSYGTPALKVGGRLLVRLKEDGASVVLQDVPFEERELLVETRPELFWFTPHYRDWPSVLMRLEPADARDVRGFVERSWAQRAPKRLVKARAARPAPRGTRPCRKDRRLPK
jgi:hypothetical protein